MTQNIKANAIHEGDLKIKSGNVNIGDSAKVVGNIFIEEGDLFIGRNVEITGSIKVNSGKVKIGASTKVKGNIFIEEGDLFCMEEDGVLSGGGAISIKKGNIFIKGVKKELDKQM